MARNVVNAQIENVEELPWLAHVAFRSQQKESLLLKSTRSVKDKKLRKRFNPMTDKDFLDFINKSQVPVEKITKELGVSKSTVQRWKDGRSLPHPAIRSSVVKAFNMAT